MPLYICRWQNGDFSAVSASSRPEAIELLDEIGNAEVCEMFTVKNFMVHFRLKEETDEIEGIPAEFEGFGEDTHDVLCNRVYPVYAKALMDEADAWPDNEEVPREKVDAALRSLNEALSAERTRQWGAKKQPVVRRFPRFPAQLSFAVTVDRAGKLAMLQGVSTDLGEGGIGGMVDGDLAPGEYVLLRISDSWLETQLEPRAQVCYRKDNYYGFAFFDVSPIAQADVRQFCGRLVSG